MKSFIPIIISTIIFIFNPYSNISAEIIKCIDSEGIVIYSNSLCPEGYKAEKHMHEMGDRNVYESSDEKINDIAAESIHPIPESDKNIAVGAPATKIFTKTDSSGDVWYAIKLPIVNKTSSYLSIRAELQALDKKGFELETKTLRGVISPESSKVLTDKTYMSYTHYISIAKWHIKDFHEREIERPTTTVSGIAIRLQSQPDSSGDVWYAIKADIANNGRNSISRVELQAIDRDGFEVDSVTVRGNISPGKKTTLTKKTYMQYTDFNRIVEWRFIGD